MSEMCRLHCDFVLLGGRWLAMSSGDGVGQRKHNVVNVEAQLVTYQEDSVE